MNKSSGFTLIELLVVVLIIGILAAVALPQYEKTVEKSRAAEAMSLVATIAAAEEVYYMANGDYSGDINLLDVDIPGENTTYQLPAKKTKNFVCRSAAKMSAPINGWNEALAVCSRQPKESFYAIVKLKNGNTVCRYYTEKGGSVCKSLGKEGTKTYAAGSMYNKDYILN